MSETKDFPARFCRAPTTQLPFVNVSIVPVRVRGGEKRFLSAAWGGPVHLFDAQGHAAYIPLPEGSLGTDAFAPDLEPGRAWAFVTSETRITLVRLDLDAARIDFQQEMPLRGMTWSAVMTRRGMLVCSAHPGDVVVYDTLRREVRKVFTPLSPVNHYGKYLQVAPDDAVIVPRMVPKAELIRLDTQSGAFYVTPADPYRGGNNSLPASSTLLPSGRYAIPQPAGVALLDYPNFTPVSTLSYPAGGEWKTFRNEEDGRLFAHQANGGPLYVLDEADRWKAHFQRFHLRCGSARLDNMFAALPGNRLLGLSAFGEVVEYDSDGAARLVTQLNNYGHLRICALVPGEGRRVFTTTFINSSFQELDLGTGQGRNVRPCQKLAGQVSAAVSCQGRLWLACYHGAEITVFDPKAAGEWPENPRPFADIGHEQLRPVSLCAEGDHLWCDTHAQYGKYGGALARVNVHTGACTVWRHLVPDHNPTGVVLNRERRRIYGGTTVWPDMQSAPAAKGPAAVYAFDLDRESVVWTAHPFEEAEWVTVHAVWRDTVIACADGRLALLRAEDGAVDRVIERKWPTGDREARLFVGGDGDLYLASLEGLFRYDFDRGPGQRLIEGPVALPCVRGTDLFFVRDYEVGLAEGLWS